MKNVKKALRYHHAQEYCPVTTFNQQTYLHKSRYGHHATKPTRLLGTLHAVPWAKNSLWVRPWVCRVLVPWLWRLVPGLSPRSSGFTPGSIHVGFVVDKVALGQVFLRRSLTPSIKYKKKIRRVHPMGVGSLHDWGLLLRNNGNPRFRMLEHVRQK
jgi:hypothetical protein